MFDGIGLPEILLILVVAMIFFGAGKLPDVATDLGKAIKNFRQAQRGDFDDKGNAPAAAKPGDKDLKKLPAAGTSPAAK